uniref:ABI gene family member 3 n=1 Tax=Salvator merianae TaxID=96440 RepID=A0A8D0KN91_SALMN
MSELQQLMQNSIPCARGVLKENFSNLPKVADYCESNYLEAQDKRKALEETMAFATQSLASVAYQISNLANDIMKMLDLQAAEVRQVEANVCSITQIVDMHKEKVARREIGTLAVCKRFPHYQKIIYPNHLEPLEPYYRKPLNFSCLDEVGHGMKDQSSQLSKTGTLSRRGTTTSAGQSSGSLRRSHRVTDPVQPPVVPEGKLSSSSPCSSLSNLTGSTGSSSLCPPTEPLPPDLLSPLPPSSEAEGLPPPPPPSPPPPPADLLLPPFPVMMEDTASSHGLEQDFDFPPIPPSSVNTNLELLGPPLLPPPPPPEKSSWAPDTYLEKVVTIYPYTQQMENELSFAEGTVIYVTRRYSDGWCQGVMKDAEGLFPGNYVEPLD